jgi:hypothetical protein
MKLIRHVLGIERDKERETGPDKDTINSVLEHVSKSQTNLAVQLKLLESDIVRLLDRERSQDVAD